MNTPIYNFLLEYSISSPLRMHMPGHKGIGTLGCEKLDLTEICGADNLFSPAEIIKESEDNATQLFDTAKTVFSTGGSTLSIQTMLHLVSKRKSGERPIIIAVRNVHTAFINACILLDIEVKWIFPTYSENSIMSGEITTLDIERAIFSCEEKPCAMYITSPDYLGKIRDISGISALCHKKGFPLIVDNAHGGYLHFLEKSLHPIQLGADICCDSAHKTLPVLTGGGYLHISKDSKFAEVWAENVKGSMSVFGSTSPSYLIMSSLDLCNNYLFTEIKGKLSKLIPLVEDIKKELSNYFEVCHSDPLRIVLNTLNSGLYGYEVADILRRGKIECEHSDESFIIFLLSSETTENDLIKLKNSLVSIRQPKIRLQNSNDLYIDYQLSCKSVMSIREAALSENEIIPLENAEGRISAKSEFTCPPGVPVIVPGEIINNKIIKILKNYGISAVNVVK